MQPVKTSPEIPPTARNKGLTASALQALLDTLATDRDEAAERYEIIRRKLIRLFAWRGSRDPEELADKTLDRVAKKLGDGLEIESADPYRYICGVAYRIFQETLRSHQRQQQSFQEYAQENRREGRNVTTHEAANDELESPFSSCFKSCLGGVSAEERDIVLCYYEGEKGERIRKRRALASRLGLQINHLRVKAHRIRHRLERCTRECVTSEPSAGKELGGGGRG